MLERLLTKGRREMMISISLPVNSMLYILVLCEWAMHCNVTIYLIFHFHSSHSQSVISRLGGCSLCRYYSQPGQVDRESLSARTSQLITVMGSQWALDRRRTVLWQHLPPAGLLRDVPHGGGSGRLGSVGDRSHGGRHHVREREETSRGSQSGEYRIE